MNVWNEEKKLIFLFFRKPSPHFFVFFLFCLHSVCPFFFLSFSQCLRMPLSLLHLIIFFSVRKKCKLHLAFSRGKNEVGLINFLFLFSLFRCAKTLERRKVHIQNKQNDTLSRTKKNHRILPEKNKKKLLESWKVFRLLKSVLYFFHFRFRFYVIDHIG